ncbi:hypothetical protein [Cysteiniphilum litorale]|uniref:hypothetical protein n=1 Tax=Cysteiniphilum litorale TaxID=2056700 RepID=UPI00130026D7|nr:hypothetical protein [Cysteiniphilum litorale]
MDNLGFLALYYTNSRYRETIDRYYIDNNYYRANQTQIINRADFIRGSNNVLKRCIQERMSVVDAFALSTEYYSDQKGKFSWIHKPIVANFSDKAKHECIKNWKELRAMVSYEERNKNHGVKMHWNNLEDTPTDQFHFHQSIGRNIASNSSKKIKFSPKSHVRILMIINDSFNLRNLSTISSGRIKHLLEALSKLAPDIHFSLSAELQKQKFFDLEFLATLFGINPKITIGNTIIEFIFAKYSDNYLDIMQKKPVDRLHFCQLYGNKYHTRDIDIYSDANHPVLFNKLFNYQSQGLANHIQEIINANNKPISIFTILSGQASDDLFEHDFYKTTFKKLR